MTTVESPVDPAVVKRTERDGRSRRRWVVPVVVLALALSATTTWAIYDQLSDESLPVDVEQLLDAYLTSFIDSDEAAFREAVTEDYLLNEFIYLDHKVGNRIGTFLSDRVQDADANRVVTVSLNLEWQVEHVGPAVITGDGPWFVFVGENWTWEQSHFDGMASYVLVERDGVLKVDNHSWAGLLTTSE